MRVGKALQQGQGVIRVLKFGIRSVEAPPGERLMFGNFMTDLSKSRMTGSISASTQPLSWPAYLPGDVVSTRAGAAPLNVMSYFSYGSIVRLYVAPIAPRFASEPSQESLAVYRYFHAICPRLRRIATDIGPRTVERLAIDIDP